MENNINNLLINSNYKILDIKNENKILYDIIFQFCEDNNILVYNINLNISNIQNTSYKLNDLNTDFIFILFSNAPKTHAIDLVDIIYKKYSKYVFYTLSLHYKEIVISIDNNRTIYFNLLFAPDIEYNSKFNIIEYNNLEIYNKKIFLLSNEIILLFITHELYKPSIFINLINDNILMEYKKSNISKIPINELTFIEKYLIILKKLFNKIKTSSNINIINRTKYNIISTFINEINKSEYDNLKKVVFKYYDKLKLQGKKPRVDDPVVKAILTGFDDEFIKMVFIDYLGGMDKIISNLKREL
jgi:hypothetical protein